MPRELQGPDQPEGAAALRSSIGLSHRFGRQRIDGEASLGTAVWSADFRHVIALAGKSLWISRDRARTFLPLEQQTIHFDGNDTRLELVDQDHTLV